MNDHHHTVFQDVLEKAGMHIYYYLQPKELFSFVICCHNLWNDIIHDKLAMICKYHLLPLQLGVGTNYLAEIRERSSFSDKATLLEHVLDKAENAGLVLADTKTVDASRIRARDVLVLGDVNTSTAKFCALNRGDEIKSSSLLPITVECYYQRRTEKNSAISWVEYILDRDACKNKNCRDRTAYLFIKEWLNFLFSYRDDISFGMWRWSCKHPKLNGHGIAGVGVTTNIANGGDDNLEIRLTRFY